MVYKEKSFEEILGEIPTKTAYEHYDDIIKNGLFILQKHMSASPITLRDKKRYLDTIIRDIKFMKVHFEALRYMVEFDKDYRNA